MKNELKPVKMEKLASISNIVDVLGGCSLTAGGDIENEVFEQYPTALWLLTTPFAQRVDRLIADGLLNYHQEGDDDVIEVPGTIYTTNPTDTSGKCCWQPVDIAKCESRVPMKRVCLEDCEDITKELLYSNHRIGKEIRGLNSEDTKVKELKDKIARWSMAMFTARNMILGMTNVETETLKPFHGLMDVMSNPAVISIDAQKVGLLNSFEMLGCRLVELGGGMENIVFDVHPLVYHTIAKAVKKDLRGDYPEGWTKNEATGEVKYMGIGFIKDINMPYDHRTGYGDVLMLDGNSLAGHMGTDLFVSTDPDFIRKSFTFEEGSCGTDCTRYYNVGAVFGNNANRLAVIQNVKITNACAEGTKDLANVVTPITPIPHA